MRKPFSFTGAVGTTPLITHGEREGGPEEESERDAEFELGFAIFSLRSALCSARKGESYAPGELQFCGPFISTLTSIELGVCVAEVIVAGWREVHKQVGWDIEKNVVFDVSVLGTTGVTEASYCRTTSTVG